MVYHSIIRTPDPESQGGWSRTQLTLGGGRASLLQSTMGFIITLIVLDFNEHLDLFREFEKIRGSPVTNAHLK